MASRVLIVDDDKALRALLVVQLEKLGIVADGAADATEAIHRLRYQHYSLILMDIQMPNVDGYEATASIRDYEKGRGSKPVPIIGISASGDHSLAVSKGMDDFLQKPIFPEQLGELVRKWIS